MISEREILFCIKYFMWELEIYFYIIIFTFCPYLNIGCRGILELKKKSLVKIGEFY